MTVPPSFPTFAGLGWSVHKKPTFSTRIADHISGREVRDPRYAFTLYEYELVIDGMSSSAGSSALGANSLQPLIGFFLQMQGQFGTFLYTDPTDNAVSAQPIGIGDGTTTDFTLLRSIGSYAEPISYVTGTPNIYLNGTLQTTGYTIALPNILTFASAPSAAVAVTADITYAFQCRFLDDQMDFENFMQGLWKVDSIKFRSVKP